MIDRDYEIDDDDEMDELDEPKHFVGRLPGEPEEIVCKTAVEWANLASWTRQQSDVTCRDCIRGIRERNQKRGIK